MSQFQKTGSEFLVNTTTSNYQVDSTIAGLINGGFVVSWSDYSGHSFQGGDVESGIKAQVYAADGSRVGSEFRVNTATANAQEQPAIAGLSNGGFVVSWTDASGQGVEANIGVKAQIYAADGSRVGSEFLINTTTANNQFNPTITGLSNGGFVVSWTDASGQGGDSSGYSIKAQIYAANGSRVGSEFLVNTTTANNQLNPTITGLSSGGFVASWADTSGQDGAASGYGIKAQIYAANGSRVGSEVFVNTAPASTQYGPTITGLSNGGFVVSWTDISGKDGDTSGYGIEAQIYAADGSRVGSEFLVNTSTASSQYGPTITGLSNGGFVVSWTDASGQGGDASFTSVKAQVYAADGTPLGSEFLVNTTTGNYQSIPAITGLSNGGFAVSWTDTSGQGGDASAYGIKAQIFSVTTTPVDVTPPSAPVVALFADTGTSATDKITSNAALTITGLEAGSKLSYVIDGGPASATYDPAALSDGAHTVVVTQTDAAGNVSTAGTLTFTLNKTDDAATGSVRVAVMLDDDAVTLQASQNLVDPDGPVSAIQLKWQSSVDGVTWIDVVGATSSIFKPSAALAGQFIRSVATYTDAFDDQLVASQETIRIGAATNDTLIGTQGRDVLAGFVGNDRLEGGAGDDVLYGGSGNDILRGFGGADILDGGNGIDVADYAEKTEALTVTLNGAKNATVTVGGTAEDTIRNIEYITSGSGNDILIGDSFNNVFTGRGGSDLLDGGAGFDTADYADKTASVVVVLNGANNATVTVGGIAEDIVRNIEGISSGSGNNVLTGDSFSNVFFGRGGADTIDGGANFDTASYSDKAASVVATLDGSNFSVVRVGGVVEDTIKNIEGLVGGSGNDILTGDSLNNNLTGNAGADTLSGLLGNDLLTGGAGNDTFVFTLGFGKDVVADFHAGASSGDVIQINSSIFSSYSALLAAATQNGIDTVISANMNDVITLKNVNLSSLTSDDLLFV